MSASSSPTVSPFLAIAAARFAATIDLPTPPLPELTATMCRTSDRMPGFGVGAGTDPGLRPPRRPPPPPPPEGAICGSWTLTFTSVTPWSDSTAARACFTRSPGSSGLSRNWKRAAPSESTSTFCTCPPAIRSRPVAGCAMPARAAITERRSSSAFMRGAVEGAGSYRLPHARSTRRTAHAATPSGAVAPPRSRLEIPQRLPLSPPTP
jgi:hypothetical protein